MSKSTSRDQVAPSVPKHPPEAFRPARRAVAKALLPVERFLAIEAASGIVLLVVAVAALVWANSPFRDAYLHLWHTPLGIRLGGFVFERDLHFVINDGLMTIFFFVVGLEIRREIHKGELSELRRAALPLMAALGGMVVPALVYAAQNAGRASASGWGVPMATDIAFAVGVLALLGKRVPASMRVLLLALAVVDDIGAIVVIAVFYSSGVVASGFAVCAVGIGLVLGMQKLGVRSPLAYVAPGLVTWAGAYASGIHPTLAGVVIGLLTPVRAWYGARGLLDYAEEGVATLRGRVSSVDDHEVLRYVDGLRVAEREAVSPVERLQHALHAPVAFVVMPLFAFANAGVTLGGASFEGDGLRVLGGVTLGLVLGKPVGIVLFSWLSVRLGFAALPRGMTVAQLWVVGMVGGIGFTMAIFVAQLAFADATLLFTAKLAVLLASAVAAGLGLALGALVLPAHGAHEGAATPSEAEASTHL